MIRLALQLSALALFNPYHEYLFTGEDMFSFDGVVLGAVALSALDFGVPWAKDS